jgi:HK97 family phage major capsid protein
MVLTRASATTVPIDSKSLSIAKLTADPITSWHTENAAITATDPTFGAVELQAKTIVCVTKLSLELSQDSANIESMLERSLVRGMPAAIDSAGLNGVSGGAGAAPAAS